MQLCLSFLNENIGPFISQVAQYLRENFKPALQKLGRFLAIQCRALAGNINQLFSRVNRYLQSGELKRKLANTLAKVLARVKEIGEAMIRVLHVQIPIAFRNLLHDFNNANCGSSFN